MTPAGPPTPPTPSPDADGLRNPRRSSPPTSLAPQRGRPNDHQHWRMARLLAALTRRRSGLTRERLMKSMDLPNTDSGVRIFRRDLRNLKARGWDISSVKIDDEHRYRLHVIDHRIRDVFTADERRELFRVAQSAGLGGLYDDLKPDAADVSYAPGAQAAAEVETVRYAVAQHCLLRFAYHGKEREVHPYELSPKGDRWLLRGRARGEAVVKKFYVDEILGLRSGAPDSAETPEGELTPVTRDPLTFAKHPPMTVVVTAGEDDVPDVASALGSGGCEVGKPAEPGGAVTVEVTTTHLDGLLMRMFELGPRVRLVGPPEARQAARDRLACALGVGS